MTLITFRILDQHGPVGDITPTGKSRWYWTCLVCVSSTTGQPLSTVNEALDDFDYHVDRLHLLVGDLHISQLRSSTCSRCGEDSTGHDPDSIAVHLCDGCNQPPFPVNPSLTS